MFSSAHHQAETLLQVISSFLIKFSFSEKKKTTTDSNETDSTEFIQVNANDRSAKKSEQKKNSFFFFTKPKWKKK